MKLLGHCKRCGWQGSNFATVYVLNPLDHEDVIAEMGCPQCRSDRGLEIEETEELDKETSSVV